jgi:uncharacterized protein (TIGR02271 family)
VNYPSGGEDEKRYADGIVTKAVDETPSELKLALAAEDLSVSKETLETGRVQVRKQTHSTEVNINEDLIHEEVVVETIPKGHRIFEMPIIREEGDTTIIPVIEEVIYTEKRIILKEEIRITRRRRVEHFHDRITLRHQEAVVSRIEDAADATALRSVSDAMPIETKKATESKE